MRILLAISGGIDSMYLANKASELFPGACFAAAHCNFQLRGEESDGDERFVREWCTANGLELFVRRFDTKAAAAERGISIEMAARDLRYEWFGELCAANGFDALATAHNANDNAETLILNLLRGTGSKGLRGISDGRCLVPSVRILRPMVGLSRKEIEKWMRQNGCGWREDSTNREPVVKRNIIRNEVFPVFERINPRFIDTLNADMKRFAQVDDIAEDYFLSVKDSVTDRQGIRIDAILKLKHWEYVLWRFLEPCSFSQETFEKLTALMGRFSSEKRGTVTLGGKTFESPSHIVKALRGHLVISLRNPQGR